MRSPHRNPRCPSLRENSVVILVDSPRRLTAANVLQDATVLLMSVGAHRFSMRELARRLGCQPAALYHYFASKEAVLQALAVQTAHSLIEAMFGNEARVTDLHACTQVCRSIEIFMTWGSKEPNLWELLFLEARAANEGQRARFEIEQRLTEPVAECRSTNRVKIGSAAVSARVIAAIAIGEVAGQTCRPTIGRPALSARQIVELCLGHTPP
jgi:AcrR family transcriptional regulator